ncbi:hypothetical protein ABIA33_004829 [Streptacidiphilus sp. MAP12-16]
MSAAASVTHAAGVADISGGSEYRHRAPHCVRRWWTAGLPGRWPSSTRLLLRGVGQALRDRDRRDGSCVRGHGRKWARCWFSDSCRATARAAHLERKSCEHSAAVPKCSTFTSCWHVNQRCMAERLIDEPCPRRARLIWITLISEPSCRGSKHSHLHGLDSGYDRTPCQIGLGFCARVRCSVSSLKLLDHIRRHSAAGRHLNALGLRPGAHLRGIRSVAVPCSSNSLRPTSRTALLAPDLGVRCQHLAKGARVLFAQVDLVGPAIKGEGDGLDGHGAVQVIIEFNYYLLCQRNWIVRAAASRRWIG